LGFDQDESSLDHIMMSRIDSWYRKISTGRHFQNGHHNTTQIQHCSISTSRIDSRHRKISTGLHFQNGHHNTANIQHVRYSKWRPVKKFRCQESIRVIIIYPHEMALKSDNAEFVVRFQRPELIPDIGKFLPVSIFKMATTIPQTFNIVRFQR
jgi:hypothetical protein